MKPTTRTLPPFFCARSHLRCPPPASAGRKPLSPLTVVHVLSGGARRRFFDYGAHAARSLVSAHRSYLSSLFADEGPTLRILPDEAAGPECVFLSSSMFGLTPPTGRAAAAATLSSLSHTNLLTYLSKTTQGAARNLTACTRPSSRTRPPPSCPSTASASSCSRRRLASRVRLLCCAVCAPKKREKEEVRAIEKQKCLWGPSKKRGKKGARFLSSGVKKPPRTRRGGGAL